MKGESTIIVLLSLGLVIMAGCSQRAQTPPPGTQIVLLGESFASGPEAVQEANNVIANAAGSGCKAISVGGYGAGLEGLVIGIPVLVECPQGTQLLPDGTVVP